MKKIWWILLLSGSMSAFAQTAPKIGLKDFLARVAKSSPEVRAATQKAASLQARLNEGDLVLSPNAYASFNYKNDEELTTMPSFTGDKTQTSIWSVGLKKQTTFGLDANLHFDYNHILQHDVNTAFVPMPDYQQGHAVLELSQSLWKNGFGEATSAEVKAARAANRAQWLEARFDLRGLMLSVEDVYWTLASLNQIIALQKENVARARQLATRMSRKAKANLVDNVDALQSEAALESRELELRQSIEQKNEVLRKFHSLLGENSMQDVTLDPLPSKEWQAQLNSLMGPDRHRADFEAAREQAKATTEKAISSRSDLKPELNLLATYSTNGLDADWGGTIRDVGGTHYPMWAVGVTFAVPLDMALVHKLKSGYASLEQSASAATVEADLYEKRAWRQLVQKRRDAQDEFERAMKIETLRAKIVKQQHRLLSAGRTTTFKTLSLEQDFASAQIDEIRAQLALIQIHNQIKAFVSSEETL